MIHLGKRSWRLYGGVTAALLSLAVVLSAGSAGAASKTAAAPPAAIASTSLTSPTGQLTTTSVVRGVTAKGIAVTGRFTPSRFFVNSAGKLIARGTLNMLVHSATPQRVILVRNIPVRSVSSPAPTGTAATSSLAAAALPAGACSILNLILGPLHLDLLGLVIDLNRVVLTIIGQTGAGNLLGNLLCAVAGLLDSSALASQLGQVAALLNSILAILQQ
jgi:hypothetical protein